MNEVAVFENNGWKVRSVNIDGEVYFVGKDVAEALGYKDTNNALKQHCRGVAKHHPIVDILGRNQDARIIAEPDLYRLVAKSNLPEAEKFETWVFEEVLPSIRKTGGYQKPMSQLDMVIAMATIAKEHEERLKRQEARLTLLEAKSETSTNDFYTIAGFASTRNIKVDISKAGFLGRKAAKLSRETDTPMGKISDPRFGQVNTYHVDILAEVFA